MAFDDLGLARRLRGVPMFADLDEAVLRDLAVRCRQERYKPNVHLFHQGADAPGLYVILRGEVVIQRRLPEGEVLNFALRYPGDCFGEISLLDGQPATAAVIAKTDVLVARLPAIEFDRFLSNSPSVAYWLLKTLARRLRATTELMASAHSQTVIQRLAGLLLQDADEEGVVKLESQRVLGERIGRTREAINRALRELCGRGALTEIGPKRYRINRSRLAQIVGT